LGGIHSSVSLLEENSMDQRERAVHRCAVFTRPVRICRAATFITANRQPTETSSTLKSKQWKQNVSYIGFCDKTSKLEVSKSLRGWGAGSHEIS
jgi:hypothetical protein